MQLDKETKLKQEKERCRQLAQRVVEEARPASVQVLNSESDLLEKALRRAGIRAEEWSAQAAEPVDLLVVEDPVWSHLPQQLPPPGGLGRQYHCHAVTSFCLTRRWSRSLRLPGRSRPAGPPAPPGPGSPGRSSAGRCGRRAG